MGGKELRIDVKLVVLSAVLITLIIAVVGLWSAKTHEQQLRQELVEQARGFAQQMDAVWTFVDANQNRINYTSDGIYEFKGLHCSVAAKAVAQLFNRSTDYVVKFTRTDPRNPGDAPDEWEQGALASFEEDPAIGEYYQLVENDEAMSLRYCTPLTVEEGCLSCHGAPKGEIDITGYAKEGWSMGDIAGALSISIPAERYIESYNAALARDLVYYTLAMCAALAILFFAVRHLVTKPLHSVVESLGEVGRGRIDMKLNNSQSTKEMSTMINAFNTMTDELDDLYGNLEQQVADRTERLQKLSEQAIAQREEIKKVNERLQQESAYKSDFLATMSHELKPPLLPLSPIWKRCNRSNSTYTDEEKQLASSAEASSKELLLIINNILETSRSKDIKEKMNWEVMMYSTYRVPSARNAPPRPAQKRDHCAESRPGLPPHLLRLGQIASRFAQPDEQCHQILARRGHRRIGGTDLRRRQTRADRRNGSRDRHCAGRSRLHFRSVLPDESLGKRESRRKRLGTLYRERVRTAPRRRGSR